VNRQHIADTAPRENRGWRNKMKTFKILLNRQEQIGRFATGEEAQKLADVLSDDFPNAEIKIVEIDQFTQYTVNEIGLNEIKQFLAENHKKGSDHFTADMLNAWAADAEFQLSEGNPACIEIRSFDCAYGRTMEYTISPAGLDAEVVEVEE
jgi:hypothetical protein